MKEAQGNAADITPKDMQDHLEKELADVVKEFNEMKGKAHKNVPPNGGTGKPVALVCQSMEVKDTDNEHCNRYANLVVKTIQEFSVRINSPPLKKEWKDKLEYPPGITIAKCVKLQEAAVGTVVQKLDGGRIKVRFPKTVPSYAPTHADRKQKDQYVASYDPPLETSYESQIGAWIRDLIDYEHAPTPKRYGDHEYEDVEVSLEQVIEASQEWVDVQKEREDWDEKVRKKSKKLQAEARAASQASQA